MVAIFGLIIPDPFAIPVIVIGLLSPNLTLLPFGRVSVVSIPLAASSQPDSFKLLKAPGNAARIFSIGINSPITPVENGSTASISTPASEAKLLQVEVASSNPCSPVPALAFPVFVTKYLG